jgi:NADH:ubiquinone oxidoreductase subunit 3 (subunit A)
MKNIILSPPIAFLILIFLSAAFTFAVRIFAAKGKDSVGKTKSYACGESSYTNKTQPDYTQFFAFAFFFTIMHVVALIIATVPKGISGLPILYLVTALMALFILFRR